MNIFQKIKLLFRVKAPAEKLIDDIKEFKSGWKTLPFWVTLLGSLGSVVAAFQGVIPAEYSLVATTVLTAIYNFIRGFEKADQNAIRPTLQSTEFWIGLLGIVGNAFTTLKTGGVSPDWMIAAQSAIAAAMAGAQNIGTQQPKEPGK